MLRGDWSHLENQVRRGLACVKLARHEEEEPPSVDLEQAASDFRYAHNLITAEETETWLARAALTFDDWIAYLERSVLMRAWTDRLDAIVSRHPVSHEEVGNCILAEAICSGGLERLSNTLAGRAAVCERELSGGAAKTPDVDDALVSRLSQECAHLLGATDSIESSSEDWAGKIADAVHIEAAFQVLARSAITPTAVQSQIEEHRVDWIRVRWRYIDLADEQAAREAALCVRDEGETLESIALEAGVAIRDEQALLERIDAALRPAVLSARPGDVVGPLPAGEAFRLAVIDGKATASAGDAEVRRRAEEEVLSALLAERAKHVRWHEQSP